MLWIRNREGETIPQELFYEGWITDKNKNGNTALMIWVEWREDEAIPECL